MKTLSLDIGTKTIGVAVSDELGITANGLDVVSRKGEKATVKIENYISPTILARLEIDRFFEKRIDDFRAQIDCVLIDTDYDGKSFKITESDLPKKKSDFIKGEYELNLPRTGAKVAVKIVDMLGEEVLTVK